MELVLAARPENVAVARQVFGGVGEALGMNSAAIADLRLAVSEACTNVVVHAYERPAEEVFEVEAWVDGPLLHLTIRDHGRGLTRTRGSDGLGMGLPIVEAVAASLELGAPAIATDDTAADNEVRMTFVVAGAG